MTKKYHHKIVTKKKIPVSVCSREQCSSGVVVPEQRSHHENEPFFPPKMGNWKMLGKQDRKRSHVAGGMLSSHIKY